MWVFDSAAKMRLLPMTDSSTVGVLIRFSNSEGTLPAVLDALQRQTRRPDKILGIASHSNDESANMLEAAGAEVIDWTIPYHHSKVLNFGISKLITDYVLILSSHTVLESEDAIEKLVECFTSDPKVACASAVWDDDPFYSQTIDWNELQNKGLRIGSIYSNSMGMIRRKSWKDQSFDDQLSTSEDYAWAVARIRKGEICCRIKYDFSHRRGGNRRDFEFARAAFRLGAIHKLPVAWMGVSSSAKFVVKSILKREPISVWLPVWDRLTAKLLPRFM